MIMCSIFGGNINDMNLVRMLAISGMARGIDATGICTIAEKKCDLLKSNIPANQFNFDELELDDKLLFLGHTRHTTRGSEKINHNNHPFINEDNSIVLAHNGVIYNDYRLKKNYKLPKTKVETDSYVIIQLLDMIKYMNKSDTLNIDIVKEVCELLTGTFALSIADLKTNSLYLLRNNNPLHMVYDGENLVYASTEKMMDNIQYATKEIRSPVYGIPENVIYEFDLKNKKFINKENFKYRVYSFSQEDYSKYGNYCQYEEKDKETKKENDSKVNKKEVALRCPECKEVSFDLDWENATAELFNCYSQIKTIQEIIYYQTEDGYICPKCEGWVNLSKKDVVLNLVNGKKQALKAR